MTSKPIVTMFYSVEHRPAIAGSGAMLRYLGGNTGNLLFRFSLQERIVDASSCQVLHLPSTLDLFRSLDSKTCRQVLSSALVIYPVANLLRPVEDFEANPSIQAETEFVTHLSKLFQGSFLVMGLGYQSRLRLEEGTIRDLHPLQVEMLDVLLQHTPGITLRGDTTLEVLRQQEMFRHARLEALGCPSLMISSVTDHGQRMSGRSKPVTVSKICLGLPSNPRGYRPLFKRLMQFAQDPRVHVVLQDASDIQACSAAGLPNERLHMFCDLNEWIAFLKSCDVCITARLHGAQAAVLAMTPVLLIATDSRMEELAQRMALNWIAMDDPELLELFEDWPTLLQRACDFDGVRYDANRRELALQTMHFLASLGLPAHPGLKALAGEEGASASWAFQTLKLSNGMQFADFDVSDYLARYPDPFLRTQNLLGLAFHAAKTGNAWNCCAQDAPTLDRSVGIQDSSSVDLAARIADDLVVLVGWSTDRSPEAQLSVQWADRPAEIVPFGQIRIRRPDVARALGNAYMSEPDFGFFRVISDVPIGADRLHMEMMGQHFDVPLQDWCSRSHVEVIDALLDACQWSHTPASMLPGLIERDLGLACRAVLLRIQSSNLDDAWCELSGALQTFRASTLCLVCLDDVLSARVQLQRLGAYASVQAGDLAVVVMLQPEIICRFSNASLVEIVNQMVGGWPEVHVLERPLNSNWQQSIQAILTLCGTDFRSCAVLQWEVLTSASDWIAALQNHPVFTQLSFSRFVPSLRDYTGQPVDSALAYLQKLPIVPHNKTTAGVETEPLLVEGDAKVDSVLLSSLPPQSREAWRARVEAGIWR